MARHEILGGLVQVYKRGGRYWNCSASLEGKQFRTTTKQQDLEPAKEWAEDWYLGLRGKARAGILKAEKSRPGGRSIRKGVPNHHRWSAQRALDRRSQNPNSVAFSAVLWRARALRDHARQGAGIQDAPGDNG